MFKPVIAAVKKLFTTNRQQVKAEPKKSAPVAKSESTLRPTPLFSSFLGNRRRGARFLSRGFTRSRASFLSGAQLTKANQAAHGMRVFLAKQEQRFLEAGKANQFRAYMGRGQ